MITFSDVSGRQFTIIDCIACGEFDHGDILPIDVAEDFLRAYPPPHLCHDCETAVEQEGRSVIDLILEHH